MTLGKVLARHRNGWPRADAGRRHSNRRAKRELCPGYERSSRHSLCKGTVFLDLAL